MNVKLTDIQAEYALLAFYLGRQKLLNCIALSRITTDLVTILIENPAGSIKKIRKIATTCCLCKEKEFLFKELWRRYHENNHVPEFVTNQATDAAWKEIQQLWIDVEKQNKMLQMNIVQSFQKACQSLLTKHRVFSDFKTKYNDQVNLENWINLISFVKAKLDQCFIFIFNNQSMKDDNVTTDRSKHIGQSSSRRSVVIQNVSQDLKFVYMKLICKKKNAKTLLKHMETCRSVGIHVQLEESCQFLVKFMMCSNCLCWSGKKAGASILEVFSGFFVNLGAKSHPPNECAFSKNESTKYESIKTACKTVSSPVKIKEQLPNEAKKSKKVTDLDEDADDLWWEDYSRSVTETTRKSGRKQKKVVKKADEDYVFYSSDDSLNEEKLKCLKNSKSQIKYGETKDTGFEHSSNTPTTSSKKLSPLRSAPSSHIVNKSQIIGPKHGTENQLPYKQLMKNSKKLTEVDNLQSVVSGTKTRSAINRKRSSISLKSEQSVNPERDIRKFSKDIQSDSTLLKKVVSENIPLDSSANAPQMSQTVILQPISLDSDEAQLLKSVSCNSATSKRDFDKLNEILKKKLQEKRLSSRRQAHLQFKPMFQIAKNSRIGDRSKIQQPDLKDKYKTMKSPQKRGRKCKELVPFSDTLRKKKKIPGTSSKSISTVTAEYIARLSVPDKPSQENRINRKKKLDKRRNKVNRSHFLINTTNSHKSLGKVRYNRKAICSRITEKCDTDTGVKERKLTTEQNTTCISEYLGERSKMLLRGNNECKQSLSSSSDSIPSSTDDINISQQCEFSRNIVSKERDAFSNDECYNDTIGNSNLFRTLTADLSPPEVKTSSKDDIHINESALVEKPNEKSVNKKGSVPNKCPSEVVENNRTLREIIVNKALADVLQSTSMREHAVEKASQPFMFISSSFQNNLNLDFNVVQPQPSCFNENSEILEKISLLLKTKNQRKRLLCQSDNEEQSHKRKKRYKIESSMMDYLKDDSTPTKYLQKLQSTSSTSTTNIQCEKADNNNETVAQKVSSSPAINVLDANKSSKLTLDQKHLNEKTVSNTISSVADIPLSSRHKFTVIATVTTSKVMTRNAKKNPKLCPTNFKPKQRNLKTSAKNPKLCPTNCKPKQRNLKTLAKTDIEFAVSCLFHSIQSYVQKENETTENCTTESCDTPIENSSHGEKCISMIAFQEKQTKRSKLTDVVVQKLPVTENCKKQATTKDVDKIQEKYASICIQNDEPTQVIPSVKDICKELSYNWRKKDHNPTNGKFKRYAKFDTFHKKLERHLHLNEKFPFSLGSQFSFRDVILLHSSTQSNHCLLAGSNKLSRRKYESSVFKRKEYKLNFSNYFSCKTKRDKTEFDGSTSSVTGCSSIYNISNNEIDSNNHESSEIPNDDVHREKHHVISQPSSTDETSNCPLDKEKENVKPMYSSEHELNTSKMKVPKQNDLKKNNSGTLPLGADKTSEPLYKESSFIPRWILDNDFNSSDDEVHGSTSEALVNGESIVDENHQDKPKKTRTRKSEADLLLDTMYLKNHLENKFDTEGPNLRKRHVLNLPVGGNNKLRRLEPELSDLFTTVEMKKTDKSGVVLNGKRLSVNQKSFPDSPSMIKKHKPGVFHVNVGGSMKPFYTTTPHASLSIYKTYVSLERCQDFHHQLGCTTSQSITLSKKNGLHTPKTSFFNMRKPTKHRSRPKGLTVSKQKAYYEIIKKIN
ncbi:uncharacterized protein LOC120329586 isoform X1 [Styela clava]